jgi:hypothetical protein
MLHVHSSDHVALHMKLVVKDERGRIGLGSFKMLGAAQGSRPRVPVVTQEAFEHEHGYEANKPCGALSGKSWHAAYGIGRISMSALKSLP